MTPRHDSDQLRRRLGSDADPLADFRRINSRPYGFYKSVIGDWGYGDFQLLIDRVQPDPYVLPSAIRAIIAPEIMGLPEGALNDGRSRLATVDFLARTFDPAIAEYARGGAARMVRPGQEVLQRSSVTVMPGRAEVRFQVQLSARGYSILGREATRILDVDAPNTVMDAFDFIFEDEAITTERPALPMHTAVHEDYRVLQDILVKKSWVVSAVEGPILARRPGVSQSPMEDAVPFESSKSLCCAVTLSHAGGITDMAIEPGVTLIVGGGYRSKSTLLSVLQRGVYAHIPGDGRGLVATTPDAMKIWAVGGRAATVVGVSAFIMHLPTGADIRIFSIENASGSTSQAAAIMETVELDSPLLLIDEDTSATNLLIRDERMRTLVAAKKEPIMPLVDRTGALATSGVSTVIVMGGSGNYLDVADRVLMLDSYRCLDVSEHTREVVAVMSCRLDDEDVFMMPAHRVLIRRRLNTEHPKTKSSSPDGTILDRHSVSLFDLRQTVDPGQTKAIVWAMRTILEEFANPQVALLDLLKRLQRRLDPEGLDTMTKAGTCAYPAFLARPRMVDIGAALNRYRRL